MWQKPSRSLYWEEVLQQQKSEKFGIWQNFATWSLENGIKKEVSRSPRNGWSMAAMGWRFGLSIVSTLSPARRSEMVQVYWTSLHLRILLYDFIGWKYEFHLNEWQTFVSWIWIFKRSIYGRRCHQELFKQCYQEEWCIVQLHLEGWE